MHLLTLQSIGETRLEAGRFVMLLVVIITGMLCLFEVLIYFILIKLCLGNLCENLIGKSELAASFTAIDTHTL